MKISRKPVGLVTGIILFLVVFFFTDLDPDNPRVTLTLAVALLMACWWITEAIPLAVTALVPLVLFPVLGIIDSRSVASAYINHIIFVFIGGFMMALAMEKWDLHRRIALKIMTWVGIGPGRILLGFMLATAFLSMWISNTAATMMMIPIITSVIGQIESEVSGKSVQKYATGVLLGIAYGSSIGGITTLVGSPANLVYPQQMQALFPAMDTLSFTQWMGFAAPISVVMLGVLFLVIYILYVPKKKWTGLENDHFVKAYRALGRASYEERIVLALFISLAVLWTFRSGIEFDRFTLPGWGALFRHSGYINDATPALFIAILLFIIPSGKKDGTRLMDWKTAQRLPWDIVLLFGGGFALARGFQDSGLAVWMGEQLGWTSQYGPYFILLAILVLMVFLTELTSNVASIQMLLPVFAALAVSSQNNPVLFMLPATIGSSMAFMLPTATPPNAIVFGTHRIEIRTMVRTGLILNVAGILVILFFTWLQSGKLA
jgi:sodium-dependent dicarboxylate transporter 2/3/5